MKGKGDGSMQRRIGFVLSACGLPFILLPLSTMLYEPDFVMCVVGFGFLVLGVFVAIDAGVSRKRG